MLKVCRIVLVVMAATSTVLFSGTAGAGMIESPKIAPAEAKANADIEILKSAMAQHGLTSEKALKAVEALPADLRSAFAMEVVQADRAGNLIAVGAAIVGIVIVGIIVMSEMLWDSGNETAYNPS